MGRPTLVRALIAEAIGTFALVFAGCGAGNRDLDTAFHSSAWSSASSGSFMHGPEASGYNKRRGSRHPSL
jgi:hypothetical protein